MTTQDKIEKRVGLFNQMKALNDTIKGDKTCLTADEETKYANIEKDFDAISAQIDREDRLSKAKNVLAGERDSNYRADVTGKDAKAKRKVDTAEYRNALDVYARQGLNGILPEFRNALQVGTASEGGYLVPTEFETQLVKLLVNLDPIRAAAHKITTASDRNIPIEVTKGTFAYIAEEAAYSESDPAVGQVVLSAFKSGGIIKVSDELLQDSFFNLEEYLLTNAADRFNTLEETNFANGDGSGKPKGIFNTASVGGVNVPNLNAGSTSAITADNLVDLYHTLGRPYRQNATWVMNDATVKYIRKIKTGISGDTTYVWQPSLVAGQPDMILGRPVVVTGGAPTIASAAKTICLIDLSKYYIADRLGTTMKRLNELYAANGQVGFQFTRRNDGRLTDALAAATLTASV
jgi:HK97 family phage major capsid protein